MVHSSSDKQAKILAIIPCYNEVAAIGGVLREFSALDFACDTLAVDDGSEDNTYEVAHQLSPAIRFEKNSGVPAAILEGIRFALAHGYDYCIQIDGDGQHIPAEIIKCLEAAQQGNVNLVIGSRYCDRPHPIAENPRRLAGSIVSCALSLACRRWLHDPLSGMRLMDRKAMEYFSEHLDITKPDALIVAQALRVGLSVKEVPVKMRARQSGTSYVSGFNGVRFLWRLIGYIIHARGPIRSLSQKYY